MYSKKININGDIFNLESAIELNSDPTTSTEANPGQISVNTTTGVSFRCRGKNGNDYIWEPTGEDLIKINEDPNSGTKISIETTDEEIEIATMDDFYAYKNTVDDNVNIAKNTADAAAQTANAAAQAANSAIQNATGAAVAAVPDLVSGWMNSHIDPSDLSVVLDTSLSISNAAADAKAAGDKISEISNALNSSLNHDSFAPNITSGKYIDNADGISKTSSSGKYATTGMWNGTNYRVAILLDNPTYKFKINYYTESGSTSTGNGYLGYTSYQTGVQYIPENAYYFVLTFCRQDEAALSSSDITAISAALSAYRSTDRTLSKVGSSADAGVVGDKINYGITSFPITNQLFPKDVTGLEYSDSSPTNKRLVDVRHNYFRLRPNNNSPTGSTYQTYLLSGDNPRRIASTLSNAIDALGADDFVPITSFSSSSPLYMCISKITDATSDAQDCRIVLVTRDPDTGTKTKSTDFVCRNGGAGLTQFYKVSDYYLPEIQDNKNLAVVIETRYAYVSADIQISFFQSSSSIFKYYARPDSGPAEDLAHRELPEYWTSEIDTSIASIHTNQMKASSVNSRTVCFITDCHWKSNKKYSPRLVKDIIDNCNIDYFVNGGDMVYIYNEDGEDAAANELWDCINAFRNVGKPMLTVYGNHDRNRDGNPNSSDPTQVLSRAEHANIVFKSFWNTPGLHFLSGSEDWDGFYWEDSNYRYVGVYWYWSGSSRMPQSFMDEIFDTTKPVILFYHGMYISLSQNMSNDNNQGNWLLIDCEPYKNQLKCIIQGHAHQDGLRWAYDGLVPIIVLDCDTFKGSPKGQAGTVSEQCISVITFDTNTIKIVRIGRGLDLEITQDTAPFLVKYTSYVPSIVECT